MRPSFAPRTMRPAHLIAATGSLAVTVSLAAVAGPAPALARTSGSAGAHRARIQLRPEPARVGFGHAVTMIGRAPRADGGARAVLQMERRWGAPWSQVAVTTIGRRGRFRFRVHPGRSARYRALVSVAGPATANGGSATGVSAPGPGSAPQVAAALTPAGLRSSPARAVTVLARFRLHHSRLDLLGHGRVRFTGGLLPTLRGRLVRLQRRTHSGWRTLAGDRTDRRGHFRLGYTADGAARQRLRLVFAGAERLGRSVRAVGVVTLLQPSVASWYYDAGATACGFHARYGVANRTLPCGTKVAFRRGSRSVTAVVDDRGPFVAGREWDLSQSTAGALGFAGVGTVWAASF
ncbi:MAG: septal ring lytic transglycosylase RlpA family protein [Solirubrobacteraceae bacterium]